MTKKMFQDVSRKKLMLSFYSSSTWSFFSPLFWILNEDMSEKTWNKVTKSTWEAGCVEGTHMPWPNQLVNTKNGFTWWHQIRKGFYCAWKSLIMKIRNTVRYTKEKLQYSFIPATGDQTYTKLHHWMSGLSLLLAFMFSAVAFIKYS